MTALCAHFIPSDGFVILVEYNRLFLIHSGIRHAQAPQMIDLTHGVDNQRLLIVYLTLNHLLPHIPEVYRVPIHRYPLFEKFQVLDLVAITLHDALLG